MPVAIGIIALNEEQFIGHCLRQHYPLADRIIVVEGADRLYPPDRVTADGLSTDRTAEIVRSFPDPDRKIIFIQHGWTQRHDAQAKCELRNRYAEHAIDGGLLAVIDADEFYCHTDFRQIAERAASHPAENAWSYPFLHFWKGPRQFITGGYYSIGHTRAFRWRAGARYLRNHNFPEIDGRFLHNTGHFNNLNGKIIPSGDGCSIRGPVCHHFGFAKSAQNIADKNRYYLFRGEGQTRPQTTVSRAAWFADELPPGHELHQFGGTLPEVFEELGWPQPAA